MRMLKGMEIGGEYGGEEKYVEENEKKKSRGLLN